MMFVLQLNEYQVQLLDFDTIDIFSIYSNLPQYAMTTLDREKRAH